MWVNWGYSGGKGNIEGKEKEGARGRARDKKAKVEEPEASGAILSFFNPLFASVNLNILFCREVILGSW